MKLYHLSDLHLGVVPPKRSAEEHVSLIFTKLKKILAEAQANNVAVVLFAGDTFDSNAISTKIALEFFSILSLFPEIHFVLIPGGGQNTENEISGHDAYTSDSIYRRPEVAALLERDNIHFLSPDRPSVIIQTPEQKIAFYAGFFGYPQPDLFPEADYQIAILHGAFGPNEKYEKPLKPDILKRYHYLALGHYHSYKKIGENAFYSGAFVPFEFLATAQAEGGFLKVDLSQTPLQVTKHSFDDVPSYLRLQIFSEDDLKKLEELDFSKVYVRIDSYLELFENSLRKLCSSFEERISISEGAKVFSPDDVISQIILELLEDVSPEIQAEVKEFLFYGLMVSQQPQRLKEFLKEKFLQDLYEAY
ncbi:metallophosphoesterase [Thermodesulfatator indicus DSM 15286]|uniref:Metallophosphoesterase n=1 Tax=Thermodesulfatator indicus (strain DSM 15286 / JCM 11887 / CIR29812) TaxID=667014 RepID=F8ACB4_THEID|nr:metallophosphoesterase [Thermodesulfatator indicus]AEH45750.1 metallophosphoesterase [Thermodesulfatator indicus DSM 15286]